MQHALRPKIGVRPRLARHNNHRDVSQVCLRQQFVAHHATADERQTQIEDDQRWRWYRVENPQRIQTVSGLQHFKSLDVQRGPKQVPQIDIILNYEDGLGRHGSR